MGYGSPKKEVENQMMIMQLKWVNIQIERVKNLKLLEDCCKRKINSIPNYIDPKFAEEKKIKTRLCPISKRSYWIYQFKKCKW